METQHLDTLLAVCGTDTDGDWAVLKDERSMTLHASEGGVALNVGKIRKIRTQGELVIAENVHGDVYVIKRASIFAGSVDPASKLSRKAGFR